MKTSELKDAALDWAVGYAQCLAVTDGKPILARDLMASAIRNGMASPSTDWAQGGPILEREGITVSEGSPVIGLEWMACDRGSTHIQHGPTYLMSAMRCYVASKLGDEIEIPSELTNRK